MSLKILKKLKYQLITCASSETYIAYLRERGANIGMNTKILSPRNSFIDENRAGYISIGNNCVICKGVTILAHDYSWSVLMKSHGVIYPSGAGPVNIGNNVFLGVNSIILRNVTLGDNVIVASGAVVTKSFGSNLVIGGNPAKVIFSLDEYCNKRKNSFVDEAKNEAKFIYKKYNRNPTEKEMHNFRSLYSSEVVVNENILGMSTEEYNSVLMKNQPLYKNFKEMVKYLLKE